MTTPLVRLAPLDLIRGFVAVGRRMSVTLAAEDLCLTQSAVSRQIHSLEDALGVSLFHRGYRSISFTPAGERLFRTADDVVRQLQETCASIMRPAERQPVTITAGIGLAASWLLPRLPDLQRRYPELDVRVAANDKVLDLRTEGIDLAIRYTSVAGAPSGAIQLFDEANGHASRHAYWLIQADPGARQAVCDVAQWLTEQARTSASAAVPTEPCEPTTSPVQQACAAPSGSAYSGKARTASARAAAESDSGERVALS